MSSTAVRATEPTGAARTPAGGPGPVVAGPECGLRERKKQQTRAAIHGAALDLVTAHGLAGVTVEEICGAAGVLSRTFFNYFPSKGHAALGLPATTVPAEARAAFTAARGPLVADLCELVVSTVTLPEDRRRMKALVEARPEMVPTMLQWMADARVEIVAAATERADDGRARTAVTLVMAAMIEVAHRFAVTSQEDLAERLRTVVSEMGRLAAG
ncbi:TetR family transcriptional regulator [Curtobacterium luteum]|uniref:TetR family transcriptional regulator n=1 Tax=Curtobacterium luteum TaxID=33881 RepID=A0A8H9L249_9MICO|nr:TetR/AcrR family transcriptional regulator [Curtobacterium luteum]GGL00653.1 TetR family transcriptional regulator [Curtobacterium luteum]